MDYSLKHWDDTAPWHPRSYRRGGYQPLDLFSDARRMERDMDTKMNLMKREMENMVSSLDRGYPAGDLIGHSLEHHIEGDQNTPGKYLMNIPIGRHVGPNDVTVSLNNNIMTVEAKKEHKSEDGHSRVYQEYMRKFTLPQNVDTKELKTMLTSDGYLKVEAPMPQQQLEMKEPQEIPIKRHQ